MINICHRVAGSVYHLLEKEYQFDYYWTASGDRGIGINTVPNSMKNNSFLLAANNKH